MNLNAQYRYTCEWSYRDELAKAIRGKTKATQDHVRASRRVTTWGCDARRGETEEGGGGTTVRLQ